MRVSGNNIMIHTGESFTIDKYFVNKDGSPYVISNRLKNPYILISVYSNSYNTLNTYKYNQWCDVSNFYRFASTQAYQLDDDNPLPSNLTILDPSVGRITNNTGTTTYYCDDTIFVHQGEYYLFVYSSNPEETASYAGSYIKYELRFIANFDSEITKNWSSQRYNYSITLVSGETMHDKLSQLYADNIGYDNYIQGVVKQGIEPVDNANVYIYKGADTTGTLLTFVTTDVDGKYEYKVTESGYYTLLVSDSTYTLYFNYTPDKVQTVTHDFNIQKANTLYVKAMPQYSNTVYLSPALYSNVINWGDGTITSAANFSVHDGTFYPDATIAISHSYAMSGQYTISIYGSFNMGSWDATGDAIMWCNTMGNYDWSEYSSTHLQSYNDTLLSATILESVLGYSTSFNTFGFAHCHSLTEISLPECTSLYSNAFFFDGNLTSVDAPKCKYIDFATFYACQHLRTVSASSCEYVGSNAFEYCASLASIDMPSCSFIAAEAFADCSALSQVNFPAVTSMEFMAFMNCSQLESINLSALGEIYSINGAFSGCTNLSWINLGSVTGLTMGGSLFKNCFNLDTIYLQYSGVVSINVSTFADTKITFSTGSVYVPSAWLSSYKADFYWSLYSTQLIGV